MSSPDTNSRPGGPPRPSNPIRGPESVGSGAPTRRRPLWAETWPRLSRWCEATGAPQDRSQRLHRGSGPRCCQAAAPSACFRRSGCENASCRTWDSPRPAFLDATGPEPPRRPELATSSKRVVVGSEEKGEPRSEIINLEARSQDRFDVGFSIGQRGTRSPERLSSQPPGYGSR